MILIDSYNSMSLLLSLCLPLDLVGIHGTIKGM